VLEVGSNNLNGNAKEYILSRKLNYTGIDIIAGPDVDKICDIADEITTIDKILGQKYELVIAMNILEHVFDPIKAIKNMVHVLNDKGYLLIIVPIIWDLHAYPGDYYRLLPDFFRKIAEQEKIEIIKDTFIFSDRNMKKFYTDLNKIPYAYEIYKGGKFNAFLKVIKKVINPIHLKTYTHLYLNLIYQKN